MGKDDNSKKDIVEVLSTQVKENTVSSIENALQTKSSKITSSALIPGFLGGYVCGKFPVAVLASAGLGVFVGLYLEENFVLPDMKKTILSYFPKEKSKPSDE